MTNNVSGEGRRYYWGPWVATMDVESDDKRWGQLYICIDVDADVKQPSSLAIALIHSSHSWPPNDIAICYHQRRSLFLCFRW